jgi:hypothetical protein
MTQDDSKKPKEQIQFIPGSEIADSVGGPESVSGRFVVTNELIDNKTIKIPVVRSSSFSRHSCTDFSVQFNPQGTIIRTEVIFSRRGPETRSISNVLRGKNEEVPILGLNTDRYVEFVDEELVAVEMSLASLVDFAIVIRRMILQLPDEVLDYHGIPIGMVREKLQK